MIVLQRFLGGFVVLFFHNFDSVQAANIWHKNNKTICCFVRSLRIYVNTGSGVYRWHIRVRANAKCSPNIPHLRPPYTCFLSCLAIAGRLPGKWKLYVVFYSLWMLIFQSLSPGSLSVEARC
jgi:hypothetical protein